MSELKKKYKQIMKQLHVEESRSTNDSDLQLVDWPFARTLELFSSLIFGPVTTRQTKSDAYHPRPNGSRDNYFYVVIFCPMNYFLVTDRQTEGDT